MASLTHMKFPPVFLCALTIAFTGLATAKSPVQQDVLPATIHPSDRHYVDVEMGYLWKVGGSTERDYGMVPVMLTWRSPEVFGLDFSDGSKLFVRNRISLLGQWIETGPENHYFGLMGAPSIEWWNAAGTAYVAANRYQLGDKSPIIYKTTDFGKTWTKIVTGINDEHFLRGQGQWNFRLE